MIKLWDTLVFGCSKPWNRERKISCPRLRKFRESSADSSSAPTSDDGIVDGATRPTYSGRVGEKQQLLSPMSTEKKATFCSLYFSRLESTRDEADKIKISYITARSSGASSSDGPRIMKASCLGQAEEGGNFTLLVRMNFSLTSARCDTEVEYNRLFKMGAP